MQQMTREIPGIMTAERWTPQEAAVNSLIPLAADLVNEKFNGLTITEQQVSDAYLSAMDFLTHQRGLRVLSRNRTVKVAEEWGV